MIRNNELIWIGGTSVENLQTELYGGVSGFKVGCAGAAAAEAVVAATVRLEASRHGVGDRLKSFGQKLTKARRQDDVDEEVGGVVDARDLPDIVLHRIITVL